MKLWSRVRHLICGGLMMDVSLRDMLQSDLSEYQQWISEIDAVGYMSRYYPKDFNGEVDKLSKNYSWYIICANQIAMGGIWLEKTHNKDEFATLGIFIGKVDELGKGIGKKAIDLAVYKARDELGYNSVMLNVRKSNKRAIKCYENCGFKIVDRGKKVNELSEEIEFYKMKLSLE